MFVSICKKCLSWDLVCDLCLFAAEQDCSMGSLNRPSHPMLQSDCQRALWPEADEVFQSQKKKIYLYFVIPQNRNKKAVTVISNRTKCLMSHTGRIGSHLKTPVWCIYSLPKPSIKAKAKQRKSEDRGKMD